MAKAKSTVTTTGLQTIKSGPKVKPVTIVKPAGNGTAQSMKKIYSPPAPRDPVGQAG